jgi:cytoskeletal protein CcmA (bactofilin family)
MFSKAKTKSSPSSPALSVPPRNEAPKAAPLVQPARKASSVPSIISADLRIEGNLFSDGDLQIDGVVQGDILTNSLTLGEGAEVNGTIRADSVRICGTVNGKVEAKSVTLAKTALLNGDVVHETLAVEAGASIDGHLRRMEIPVQEPVADPVKPDPLNKLDAKSPLSPKETAPAE